MKALFTRQSIIIASAAVLIAVITIVSVNVFSSPGPVTGLANAISSPVRALASSVTSTFERIYASIYRYDNLMAEYERVVMENTQLRQNTREATLIADENAQLRAMLGFRERHADFEKSELAVVRGGSGSNWSSSFTVNRGHANSEIQRGDAVITEYGVLIGQVTDVGATISTVVTVLDTTFSAGAYIGEGDAAATVKGDFNLMRVGLIMLDHFDDDLVIIPGDSIVTSGAGGVFPAGLIVGEVVEVHSHSTGVGRYATVRPLRGIDALSIVFIITGFEVSE